MSINDIMKRVGVGENVSLNGEAFGVGEYDDALNYLKEFKKARIEDGDYYLRKWEYVQSASEKLDMTICVITDKKYKPSVETLKALQSWVHAKMSYTRVIASGVTEGLKRFSEKYELPKNSKVTIKQFVLLNFTEDGKMEFSVDIRDNNDDSKVIRIKYNLKVVDKKASGENFIKDLIKATKYKVSEWVKGYNPKYIKPIEDYGVFLENKNLVVIQKSYPFPNKDKSLKGRSHEVVYYMFKDVEGAKVENITDAQKRTYNMLVKSPKNMRKMYFGIKDSKPFNDKINELIREDPRLFYFWIEYVAIEKNGDLVVETEVEVADEESRNYGGFLYIDVKVSGNKFDQGEPFKHDLNVLGNKPKKVGESLSELKEDFLKKVKFSALSESSDDFRGPVPALSEKIIEIKDRVVDFVSRCENVDPSNLGVVYDLSGRRDNLIKDINSVSTVLNNSDSQLNDRYQETIANSILAIMTADDEVKSKDLTENSVEEIKEKDQKDIEKCTDCNPTVGKTLVDEYDKVDQALDATKKNLVYEPVEDPSGRVPAAEKPFGEEEKRAKSKWDKFADNNMLIGGLSIAGSLISATDLITKLLAVPINAIINGKNYSNEKKYGSALNIQQPLVATDDISKSVVAAFTRYLETSTAIDIKQTLESSIARTDGGNLMSRSKNVMPNTFTKMNRKGNNGKNVKTSHDEILASFSQDFNPIVDCLTKVLVRNGEAADFIFNIQSLVSKGEAGEFINDNKYAPKSTIEVELMYKDINNGASFDRKVVSKKSTLTVDIVPRKLPYEDIVKTFIEMNDRYFSTIKVTPAERNTDKTMKNSIALVKKQGTAKEKSVLTSNKFADIVNKIEKVRTPLFHIVISSQAYYDIKERGLDLKKGDVYRKLFKRLPIISLTIIDEDSEIVSTSMGPLPAFRDIQIKDLENEISKYEKELQSMIKFGMQR